MGRLSKNWTLPKCQFSSKQEKIWENPRTDFLEIFGLGKLAVDKLSNMKPLSATARNPSFEHILDPTVDRIACKYTLHSIVHGI